MTPDEKWLPVAGYEGLYEVSDQGRVKSLARRVPRGDHTVAQRERILSPHTNPYLAVALHANGTQTTKRVHALVAEAFLGPRPAGLYVCHNNGDHADGRLSNLRYDTPSANEYDAVHHGVHPEAKKTHCKRGHEFTPENTYVMPQGWRSCRECKRLRASRP